MSWVPLKRILVLKFMLVYLYVSFLGNKLTKGHKSALPAYIIKHNAGD